MLDEFQKGMGYMYLKNYEISRGIFEKLYLSQVSFLLEIEKAK
jgi:hypothetical protein